MTGAFTLIDENSVGMTWSGSLSFSWEGWQGLAERRREALNRKLYVTPIEFVTPVGLEKSTFQVTKVTPWKGESVFVPRTALGRKLLEIRNEAIAAGMRLLTEDEVLEEMRRRRGEMEGDEKDLY